MVGVKRFKIGALILVCDLLWTVRIKGKVDVKHFVHGSQNIKTKWRHSMTYVHVCHIQFVVHCELNK